MQPRVRTGRFEPKALRAVALRLAETCEACGACAIGEDCGVRSAQDLLLDYLQRGRLLVDPPAPVTHPEEAAPDDRALARCAAELARLCSCCLFHRQECVLNRTFGCLEAARGLRFCKPASIRPSDYVYS